MRRGRPVLEPVSAMDTESELSYASGPKSIKPTVKVVWRGGKKVDEENFLHMQGEYYRVKQAEKANEETMRQLTAQLARTEEAAKRAMVARDPSAKGGAAQRLLDMECELSRVQADHTELETKYLKERKRAGDFKTKSEELKRRLDTVLRDQRQLVQRVGNAEARRPRTSSMQSPFKPTDENLSSTHRQLAEQQQELNRLRQEAYMLKEAHQATAQTHQLCEAAELQNMLSVYKEQVSSLQQRVHGLDNELNALKKQQADTAKGAASQLILETMQFGGQTVFVDQSAGQAYTRGKNSAVMCYHGRWSQHTGLQPGQQGLLLSTGLAQLQRVASSQRKHLKPIFEMFDPDHIGSVAASNIPALLAKLLPTTTTDDMQFIQAQLAIANKDRLTLDELLTAFEEAMQASEAMASAAAAIPEEFQQLCTSIKQCKQELADLFGVYDTRALGTLEMKQVSQLLRRILRHVSDLQLRQLVAKLHGQGVSSAATLQDLFDAFQLGVAPKLHSGMHVRSSVSTSPAVVTKAAPAELQSLRQQLAQLQQTAQQQTHACSSKDAELQTLRHALRQLQQELHRAEKIRLAAPVPHAAQHGTEVLEEQIRAAWDKANVLKTRFVETRNAFEQLKAQHARVVQELGDKVHSLHEQRMKQLNLERECSRLRQDLDRLAVLQPLLDAERGDRQRLEKENSSLMAKTFAAPSTALVELQGLKTEVYSLRREKANAELREAEARRELADQTSKGSGTYGLPAEMLEMHQELTSAHKLVAHLKIELDAARSQLEIFRSVMPLHSSMHLSHSQQHTGAQSDSTGANVDLHRQVADLQSKYQAERLEGDKIHQLLAYEETRRCNLEESLDQVHKHARDQHRSLQNQVAQLQQECSGLELLVHNLEAQLRSRTDQGDASPLQQSQPAVAHSTDLLDSTQGLSADESIVQLHVERAELHCTTGTSFATYVELDFFQHATQATPVMQGPRPQYDTTVQFVVNMERLLAEHNGSSCLALRLQHSTGYVSKPLGAACLSLQDLLRHMRPSLTGSQQAPSRDVQVLGNHGEVLGAITYSVTTHCPVPSAHQAAQRVQPQSQAQPESQQHDFSLPAAVTEADSTDSSISSVAPVQTASFGGQSQPGSHAAADAVSDAAASQDSTALTAFGTHRRTASKHDERAPLAHVQQGTKAVSSSLDKDLDADSLISSSSDDEHEAAFEAPDASEIARQAEHALHRPSSTEDRDPTTSAPASEPRQTSSRRTTTDSLLDRLLHEVDAATLARQRSAAPITTAQPCDATRRDKADAVHAVPNQGMTGPRLAASNSMQSTSSNSNTRRNSASGAAANVQPSLSHDDQTQAPSGYRSTADSVLASVLHEVEHEVEGEADQASIDSLLDGVLAEVAGTASQQRTTADSVLDAMLDDISSSQMEVQSDRRQLSSQHSFQGDHLQQQQLQAEEEGDDSSVVSGSPRAMLPSAAQPLSCRGRARYDITDSNDGLQDALASQVCCPLASSEPQDWPDLSSHIVIAIESLELAQSVQQDGTIQSVFVMYNFLPQFCQSAQDQCTQALPKQLDIMQYNHIVAYGVGSNSSQRLAARQELANQLHSPDEAVIPVCLVCEQVGDDAEQDYSQFGSGEISLQGILELEQDLCHHKMAMSDAQHHHVGYLTISVRALQAFCTMQG